MSEHHSYFVTLNNPSIVDLACVFDICTKDSVDFCIVGLEGCPDADVHHDHIHAVIHFKSSVKWETFRNYFKNKKPNIQVVKDMEAAVEYVRGYEKGELKCDYCSWCWSDERNRCENYTFGYGEIPVNGKKKGEKVGELVLAALNEGKQLHELRELFPMYMVHHGDKVAKYIRQRFEDINKEKKVDYKYVNSTDIDEVLDVCHTKLELEGRNVVVVYELSQLELYSHQSLDVVIYISDVIDREIKTAPYGSPLFYKHGYEYKRFYPSIFIVATSIHMHRWEKLKL